MEKENWKTNYLNYYLSTGSMNTLRYLLVIRGDWETLFRAWKAQKPKYTESKKQNNILLCFVSFKFSLVFIIIEYS